MNFLREILELVQALLVSLGILVGGLWTYFLFVRKRLAYPRANLELSADASRVSNETRLIHAVMSITNTGDTLLRSAYAEIRLRQIVPLPESVAEAAREGYDPVPRGRTEVEWPSVVGREWDGRSHHVEIEPGESDCLHADFLIGSDIEVVELYCFVENSRKKNRNVGWTCTKIYSFDDFAEVNRMADRDEDREGNLNEQQKQQSQQERQQQQQPKQEPKQDRKPED